MVRLANGHEGKADPNTGHCVAPHKLLVKWLSAAMLAVGQGKLLLMNLLYVHEEYSVPGNYGHGHHLGREELKH